MTPEGRVYAFFCFQMPERTNRSEATVPISQPTGNLDPRAAREILDLFDRLHADGRTIVWITHDQQAAKRAERRILMHEGKLCPEQENQR